jgi:hypothetical protein
MPVQPFVQLWIWISMFATLAGWILSAFGQLNRGGYAVAFVLFAIFIFTARKNHGLGDIKNFRAGKLFFRFRRPLPFCFAALAVLIFIGGALYPPDNYTGLTYRVPRVLQWLAHGHWFWIHTTNYRMNDRACGIEWLTAPLLLFTKSTRLLFLLNFLPFLLLPGLTFSVLHRLGVRPRVAWQWMWLLPTGYNFLLQAGSAANDTFPTVYALAAVDFALRARQSKSPRDTINSILAAALLVGAKANNIPLLLPWAILLGTNGWWRTPRSKVPSLIIRYVPIMIIAAAVSFLPTAILNSIYSGDWTGASLEEQNMVADNPFAALAGNAFQLLLQNFCPPFFPWAAWWNAHAPELFPQAVVSISKHFIMGFFQLGEMPTEDSAGLGLGLSVLLAVSAVANFLSRRTLSRSAHSSRRWREGEKIRLSVLAAPWLALLVYSVKSGMTTAARLIAPYYPLLLPSLVTGRGPSQLVRSRGWRILVFGNLILAFAVLILTPPRPLWPAQTILSRLVVRHPGSHLLDRAQKVYSLYSGRFDPLPEVRNLLPQNIPVVGFAGGTDDSEISFWLPFDSRRVEDFLVSDSPAQIQKQGIEYAVVSDQQLPQSGLENWLKKSGAQLLYVAHATLKITTGEQTFYVVRFKP